MELNDLSKLEYNDVQFDSILQFVSQIANAKIGDVDDAFAVPLCDLRKDEIRPSLPQADILSNAPETDGEYFIVPKVVV